ncbi:hypothetical protein FKM82_003534 [Ascaphus truei]
MQEMAFTQLGPIAFGIHATIFIKYLQSHLHFPCRLFFFCSFRFHLLVAVGRVSGQTWARCGADCGRRCVKCSYCIPVFQVCSLTLFVMSRFVCAAGNRFGNRLYPYVLIDATVSQ